MRSRVTGRRLAAVALAGFLALAPGAAEGAAYPLAPGQKAFGRIDVYVTHYEDTLLDVARVNDLGYSQLMTVNPGLDPWLPGAGRRITLPGLYLIPEGPRRGIVISLAEQRLYYFPPDGRTIETYPIGVGVQGRTTPIGTTQIAGKDVRPAWYPPPSIRAEKPELPEVVPPGPDNPLGEYALRLGWPNYSVHGTNKPYGVGRNVSHGCIRLYPEDIERLFREVAVGTPVRVISDEFRLAWVEGELYLAAFPSKTQSDELAVNEPMTPAVPPGLVEKITAAAGGEIDRVDWDVVDYISLKRPGIPYRITKPLPSRGDTGN
ncbi:MAG TPA: L,D-transpeptidase family protein [Stellaceae bacterium]|nr:L,D-transpeptidase family protein [Stellaceae bacterium]